MPIGKNYFENFPLEKGRRNRLKKSFNYNELKHKWILKRLVIKTVFGNYFILKSQRAQPWTNAI